MKNFTNNFKQFTSRLSARWLIMALMMLVGTSSVWGAQSNLNWQGKVYFLVPETWDISAYSYVQVDITRTKTATESNYQFYAGRMTRIGTSRLFYLQLSADHSSWNQNEYITFTANDHEYGSGTFNINGNHYYATPLDFGCNNSNNYYLFKPSPESEFTTTEKGNTIEGSWSDNRNILKAAQTVNIYTNGTASNSGGSVNLTGYYFNNSDTAIEQSTATSTSATETYNGAVIGSEMTLTASANTGYEFDGWYNEASGGTLLSSNTSYTYNVYGTKTIYARFKQSCVTVEEPDITSNSPICLGSELTLTLNKRQEGVKYEIDDQEIFTENNNTYSFTPQESGSLTVVASHEQACNGATNQIEIQYIVNALPSAPALNVPEGKVCAGDLILDDYIDDSETNTVNWYKNSGCTEPATNPNLEPSVEKTFYAKSKDGNNCISSGYSELTLTSYALPPDFTVTVSDNEVCSGEDVTINIEGREIGVDYELENEVIPAEGITVNPTKNTTYSVIASLSECQNMTNTEESQQITVNGTTITQSPEVVHPYEVVTFTAGEQATWAIHNNPSSGGAFESETYTGKTTAYITKGASQSTTFKGEAASGYVIRATVGDCSTDKSFDVVADPECE